MKLDKGDFIGREALLAAQEPERRLCCLVLDDPRSVALGSEPVRVEGAAVGRVTSGGYGYSVERSIAYAYLPAGHAQPRAAGRGRDLRRVDAGRGRGRAALGSERRTRPGVIDELVARVWPAGVESVEPLGGGITNRNFKVRAGGEDFVLRVGGKDTELLGIDRDVEHEASLAASRARNRARGGRVPGAGGLSRDAVRRGRDRPRDDARRRRRSCGASTRAPPIPGRFDAFRVVEAYAEIARSHGVALPAGFAAAKAIADRIEARRGAVSRSARATTTCWRRTSSATASGSGSSTGSTPGMGDPAFDLANFAVSNGLDDAGDRELLAAYGGADLDVHVLMRFISDFREAMWGLVQQAVADIDFDFAGYAAEHFERLEQTAAEPRFRDALG